MKRKIVITGITGFLGKELLKYLDTSVFDLIFLGRTKPIISEEVSYKWICADISSPEFITNEEDKKLLLSAEIVYHGAAFYDLKGSYNDCFLNNVVGTSNLANFFKNSKKLRQFHYVSTIAVIDPIGEELISEDNLPKRSLFNDYYSQTKYAAEKLFREFQFSHEVKKIIYRPGVIVVASDNELNYKMDGPYYFAKALKQFRPILNFLPFVLLNFNSKAKLPMVPVDHVAKFIARSLLLSDQRQSTTYHLVSDELPTIPVFMDELFYELRINTQLKNSSVFLINKLLLSKLGIPKETIPFMFHCHSYDKSNTYRDFSDGFNSHYKDFKYALLKSLKDV